MRKRFLSLIVALSVAMIAVSFSAYAQSKASEMVAKVSFDFKAGDTSLPAGSYKFTRRSTNAPSIVISPEKGGESTIVPVITRLAQRSQASAGTSGNLVFDNIGGTHVLSEVWIPGQDGFLVRATTEEHQHDIVAPSSR